LGRGEMHRQLGTRSLLTVLRPRAPWELALEALEQLRPAHAHVSHSRRLVWKVEVYRDGASMTMEPVEQRHGPKGWSDGRPVALTRLAEGDYLSEADRAICRCIRQERTGYYGRTDTFIEIGQAAVHLIGHPLVVHRETGLQLRVRATRPRLQCMRQDSEWWLTWDCPPAYRLDAGVLEVFQQSAAELGMAGVLREGLLVPPEGQEAFLALLGDLDISIFHF